MELALYVHLVFRVRTQCWASMTGFMCVQDTPLSGGRLVSSMMPQRVRRLIDVVIVTVVSPNNLAYKRL